jgi:hypothetical protein
VPKPVSKWIVLVVSLLTALWVPALFTLMWWMVSLGLTASAYERDNQVPSPQLAHDSSVALLVAAAVAVGGPAVIAVIAFAGRAVRTGAVYATLALLLLVLAGPAMINSARSLRPDPPPTQPALPGEGPCVERSGGDTRCPGG